VVGPARSYRPGLAGGLDDGLSIFPTKSFRVSSLHSLDFPVPLRPVRAYRTPARKATLASTRISRSPIDTLTVVRSTSRLEVSSSVAEWNRDCCEVATMRGPVTAGWPGPSCPPSARETDSSCFARRDADDDLADFMMFERGLGFRVVIQCGGWVWLR
jgi:hypothetical protein